jgi:hypothetical protein
MVDSIQEQEWITLMKILVSTSSQRERVLNCDETTWRLYPTGMKTWTETGTQNVQTHIDGNEKDSLTVMVTVTTVRTKLPLVLIASGKTEQ